MSLSTPKAWQIALQSLLAASALTLVGCDGGQVNSPSNDGLAGDGSGNGGGEPGYDLFTQEGTLISQRSTGARICFDVNNNRRCDTLEPSATAASDGSFSLEVGKASGSIIAELPADEMGTVVRLFAHQNSPTVSALTTVLHWSVMANPNRPAETVAEEIMQSLALKDLDSQAPETLDPHENDSAADEEDAAPAEEGEEGEDSAVPEEAEESEESVAEAENTELADPADERMALVRQTIELLIAKYSAAAEADALAAGLDPGLNANQPLLNMLVADQVLQQFDTLSEAVSGAESFEPQVIVDAMPDARWPSDDIVLAMQMFAGDAPMETDPIALLEDGLNELLKTCATNKDCSVMHTAMKLDDSMNLSTEKFTLFPDGSRESAPIQSGAVNNLVLSDDGEWLTLDSSGMSSVARTGDFSAEETDGNDNKFGLRSTARTIADSPVAPLLDTLGLAAEDFPHAEPTFGNSAKLVKLQREQLNDRYEMLYSPPQEALELAAAEQALVQAELTLQRLERNLVLAESTLSEAQFNSEQSSETENAALAEVDALDAAKTAIESALETALLALEDASSDVQAVEDSEALVAAYQSVFTDAEDKLELSESAAEDAVAAMIEAEAVQQAAEEALAQAILDLAKATGNVTEPEPNAEPEEDAVEGESESESESESDTIGVDPVIVEAEAAKLAAERDLIVADAAYADAKAVADSAAAAVQEATLELADASAALAEAEANLLDGAEAETILQSAQLLVDANEASLALIEQQMAQAEAEADTASEQADTAAAELVAALETVDDLNGKQSTAIDDLASAQASVATLSQVPIEGCAEKLPLQSLENYNCNAIERRIGDSPATVVPTLSELTATQSALTLLNLHADYAVTLLPANGASSGNAAWHGLDDAYEAGDDAMPQSNWSKETINDSEMITITVPSALQEPDHAKELLMVEHDHYVRAGVIRHAGSIESATLLNDAAVRALMP